MTEATGRTEFFSPSLTKPAFQRDADYNVRIDDGQSDSYFRDKGPFRPTSIRTFWTEELMDVQQRLGISRALTSRSLMAVFI